MFLEAETQQIYDSYVPRCVFHNINHTVEPPTSIQCGNPALAVYISADDDCELRAVCEVHRETARHGDGPVYDLVPVREDESC